MARKFGVGDCVRIPDGRVGRVRGSGGEKVRVRVRRRSGKTHHFLLVAASRLSKIRCPSGWMSKEGYVRYLQVTLSKMKARRRRGKS
jgi:hypothetical protein